MNTERGTAWFVHIEAPCSCLYARTLWDMSIQIHIGSITNTLLFLEASTSGLAVVSVQFRGAVMPGTSPADTYFCLHICGFGPEGCETVQFERSRFGSWRSAVP